MEIMGFDPEDGQMCRTGWRMIPQTMLAELTKRLVRAAHRSRT
jgi:hypothetical protein